ncbi:MAG: hypothetical protein HOE62_01150 [Alphaproteobacteria bacterium]|jgi:hypothetical protein|nr:hypothetical protein [Alphaproteobacteria bacterium]MBT4967189.1 hypothetical protein [Alphaproteobacteria bacterium]MBT5160055.1 hypothetical protein [Alphaproteobacteria bacterium]MBT5918693.1 hypothetical protein [Alphaproteobacteria bacterium]MBT6385758.1 hypothetical protein [Alphaproteobacteria bacterium]
MDVSTHFAFQHRVFSAPGSYFTTDKSRDRAVFVTPMGESNALVQLPSLRKEFGISAGSDDGDLLDIVDKALKFVDTIRINDSIPNELLDGSASWSVADRHQLVARARLTIELVAWVTGKPASEIGRGNIVQELEKPEIRAKIKESIGKLAQHLELENGGDGGVVEVERRMDDLVHETAFVEALRERLMLIHSIGKRVKTAGTICHNNMAARESLERVPPLLTNAYKKLDSEFTLLDKQNQNVADVLRDMDSSIYLIRAVRDEIHCTLKIWDNLVAAWQERGDSRDTTVLASLLSDTHRFLAENYPIVSTW